MADTDKKNLIDEEKAAAFKEIDAAVEEEAAAKAAFKPTETDRPVDPMAGALGEGLSLLEENKAEATSSEESAEDAVPEAGETPAEDQPEGSPEAEEASEDEVETLEEGSDFARADAPATGMPEGELSGEVAPGAAESTSTEAVEMKKRGLKKVLTNITKRQEPQHWQRTKRQAT